MNIWDNLVNIRKELLRGEIEVAIFSLEKWMNQLPYEVKEGLKDISDQLIHLSSQFFQGKKRDKLRMISTLDLNIINNHVTNGLIEVCRELEKQLKPVETAVEETAHDLRVLLLCNQSGLSKAKELQESLQDLVLVKILLI
ncbi:MAG: hypothetical protein MRZ79_10335 [Bacteroidia bacterium]|nr:hypothetical protein [Bacteroidia bacterium]